MKTSTKYQPALIAAIMFFVGAASAADIVIGKDSLCCINTAQPGWSDYVVLTNNADYRIDSDSMYLDITEVDSGYLPELMTRPMQVFLSMNNYGSTYACDSVRNRTYKLRGGTAVNINGYGATVTMERFKFGSNVASSSAVFPLRWRGVLSVFFPNGDTVKIRLYTGAPPSAVHSHAQAMPLRQAVRVKQRVFGIDGRMAGLRKAGAIWINGKTIPQVIVAERR